MHLSVLAGAQGMGQLGCRVTSGTEDAPMTRMPQVLSAQAEMSRMWSLEQWMRPRCLTALSLSPSPLGSDARGHQFLLVPCPARVVSQHAWESALLL